MRVVVDPVQEESDEHGRRMFRGGGYHNHSTICRTGFQDCVQPSTRNPSLGFRPALSLESTPMHMTSPTPLVAQALAILQDPADLTAWFALADMLEEDGQDDRANLLRFTTSMRSLCDPLTPEHDVYQRGVQAILARGVRPCWPQVEGHYGITYSLVPAGAYLMGDDRRPVAITRPFLLATTPVTQAQWRTVMGDERRPHFHDRPAADRLPMESVSWHDAQAFCQKLTTATGATHRLPTEAEWEYACRAGTTTAYHQGDDDADLKLVGHYQASAPRPVGELLPNAWGLHDMHGNVWEWCQDGYHANPLEGQEVVEVDEEEWRRVRGGCWWSRAPQVESGSRQEDHSERQYRDLGFRVAVDPQGGDEHRTVKGGSWLNDRWRLMVADYVECEPEDHCHHLGFRVAVAVAI